MSNPWAKKNPFMSMWLSGANSVMGSARGRVIAQARRQSASLAAAGAREMIKFWTDPPAAAPKRKRRKSR
jgi:hypothetical protein